MVTHIEFIRSQRAATVERLTKLEPEVNRLHALLTKLDHAETIHEWFYETHGEPQPIASVAETHSDEVPPAKRGRKTQWPLSATVAEKPNYQAAVLHVLGTRVLQEPLTKAEIIKEVRLPYPDAPANIIGRWLNHHVNAGSVLTDGETYWLPPNESDMPEPEHETPDDEAQVTNWDAEAAC